MDRRLPPRDGEWIDRGQPVDFRFEGHSYHGFAGDVLSSALWANDVRMLGRSFKYHRPRGVYSLANHDINVLVEDGERTNMRGDVLLISPGLEVRAVNTFGGLQRDRLRVTERFSRFLPVGFYYKGFHTPRRLFPFYENQMRKVAGLGQVNPANQPVASPKDYAFCDLLVVGAGPAGLAAAIAAAEQGVDVLLVDEQPRLGGSLAWQQTGESSSRELLSDFVGQIESFPNLRVRTSTQAAGCYADHWIALIDERRLTKLRAKAMLVAAGCYEQPAVFGNNDLPGVMLGSAAQRLIHLYAVKPFDRAVVLTANREGYRVALDLHEAGVEVAAVVDLRAEVEIASFASRVNDLKIEIHNGHIVSEATPAADKVGIGGAIICPFDEDGKPRVDSKRHLDCDGIAISVGWMPNVGLAYQAGGRFRYSEHVEQLVPDDLPPSLFIAGRANGVSDLQDQIADGRRSGLLAAAQLGRFTGEIPDAPIHQEMPPSHPFPIVSHAKKKNFVDLDEDLHLVDFENAHQEGYDNIELLKRYTTVGMGPSQGKLSNMNAVRILARLNGASINETGTTTSRPFHHPVPIGHLAGRRFHPLRRTPIHNWHEQAGAEMVHAGNWLRPEYYRGGETRDDCILTEAQNVRNNVGLIDVGTLGKIQVSGPDAVRFLEHIYTGRFAKQQVGKLRYGLACDETGVIIEDGVVARLSDDRFYITATSSGAATFYRELQRWALIFGMDVVLANATGHLAAMNVAGPHSRQLLQELTDLDLASDAFPYLGVGEGQVAGAPAVFMRVGFVGELGYEIHVPASYGLHVWNSLMTAGEPLDIRPFGVEAQRLLRLEKGHLIVGQDTDALTNPFEADVAWAIGKKKPFFVGSRSLEIAKQKPLTRRLVGIRFPSTYRGPLPEECHLIIANGEITGRITSIAHHSTLGQPIALAFVRPDMTKAGTVVRIRVKDESLVEAKVAALPFYDTNNSRQD
jgi:sarcosine oxidase subunit alpha